MRLKDKVAVFIGGASEIATATGKKFIREGASLLLADANKEFLNRAFLEYNEGQSRVKALCADARDYEEMQDVMRYAVAEFGKVDIVVNCAGILIHKPIDVLTVDEWNDVLDINLTGMFNTCKAVTPHMKERSYGRIINISSVGGRTGRPGVGVNYAAAKAGVIGLSQTLAKELAPWNITVNVVAPGPLRGRMFLGMAPELVCELERNIPLGRLGTMDEIAHAIVYLASDEAAWTTGEVLDVNGGVYI